VQQYRPQVDMLLHSDASSLCWFSQSWFLLLQQAKYRSSKYQYYSPWFDL